MCLEKNWAKGLVQLSGHRPSAQNHCTQAYWYMVCIFSAKHQSSKLVKNINIVLFSGVRVITNNKSLKLLYKFKGMLK